MMTPQPGVPEEEQIPKKRARVIATLTFLLGLVIGVVGGAFILISMLGYSLKNSNL